MGPAADKYRVQLDFTPEAFRELENVKTAVQASSRADTVRYAIRVLRWLIEELRSGARIAVYKNQVFSEVKFPFLPQFEAEPKEPIITVAEDRDREWVNRGHETVDRRGQERADRQREQFKAAKEAGRQAYRDATRREEENR